MRNYIIIKWDFMMKTIIEREIEVDFLRHLIQNLSVPNQGKVLKFNFVKHFFNIYFFNDYNINHYVRQFNVIFFFHYHFLLYHFFLKHF